MKKKRLMLIMLILLLIISTIPVSASGETKQLKDLSPGSIVYDSSWQWEHKTENGYTGSGTTKSVEWIVVAKNHTEYPSNSVTLLSNELIGKYYFDNSTDRGHQYGSNHWGDSGTGNATSGIRPFLNTSFFNTFSNDFKDLVLETTLNMKTYSGGTYTSKDKVFLPSENELGGSYTTSDGSNWGYFSNNNSRITKIGSDNWYYWTRSPYSGHSISVRYVNTDGSFSYHGAYSSNLGVRPALNLKSDTPVKSVEGKWKIIHNSPPTMSITNPSIAQTINSAGKITISGKITDPDGDTITISATIGNIPETTIIIGPADNETWTLEWTGADLKEGTDNDIKITAKDDKDNITTDFYTGTIIVDKTPPKLELKINNE